MLRQDTKEMVIAGQYYILRVRVVEDGDSCYGFTLQNREPLGTIPGGMRLRLLTLEGKSFDGNEARAIEARAKLEVKVWLQPGEGVIWETEPMADGYVVEPWFV